MSGIPMNMDPDKLRGEKLRNVPSGMEYEAATIVTSSVVSYLVGQASGQDASLCTPLPL